MTISEFDPLPAARLLASAWREHTPLDGLPQNLRPPTLSDGYALQRAFVREMDSEPVGWKLGVGSPAAMRAANAQRPLIGQLLAPRVFHVGDTVSIAPARPVTVEFEIVYVLGRDVAPGKSLTSPLDAVAATHIGFEFVLSRYADRKIVGLPSFAGDNVGFEAFVLGAEIDRRALPDVISSIDVSSNGVSCARGLYGDEATDPVTSLGYLFEFAAEHGITLHEGDIVTTGAAAKPFDVASGDFELTAKYLNETWPVRVSRGANGDR